MTVDYLRHQFEAYRHWAITPLARLAARLPRRALGSVERRGSRALPRLLAKLSVSNASAGNELHQFQRELVRNELVMGK